MRQIPPIPLKDKYWLDIQKEIERIFNEVLFIPLYRAVKMPTKELQNSVNTLYVMRPVLNGDEILKWAKAQGFKTHLPADDLHITLCFSRQAIEWDDIGRDREKLVIPASKDRKVSPLGDKGAVVLHISDSRLEARHRKFREYGASWDYDGYRPHLSITYDGKDVDLSKVKPYTGKIVLGEERFAKVKEDWGKSIKEVRNAPSTPLEKAIAEGKVWYAGGKFHANQWNAALSRELREMGAKFNKASKIWTYTAALPAGVSFAVAAAAARYDAIKKAVLYTLDSDNIQSIDNLGNLPDRFEKSIKWLDGDFNKALKAITIPPQLTQEEINGIAVDYAHSVSLPIKDWAHETVLELRQEVQNMVYAGQRPDAIARLIQTKYGQSKRKAKFLASQETRLMKGTFDRERAKSVGSQKYVWRGRMDAKERDSHVELEGEVIFIDSPPVVDHKTGRRAHAGEDYNCRCVPIYIIE